MPTITNRALRGSTIVAFAAIGVLGLAGCSGGGGADEEPTSSGASEESAAPEGDASGEVCSSEQINTLMSASGGLPEAATAAATADFQPADLLGDLPTTCLFAVEQGGVSASFAVLPGGTATLTTIAEQGNAAGGSLTDAGGAITGTVGDLTVAGVPFTSFTQETAGFEGVDDLVVVASTSLGG
ncbi:hypothetical protein [Agrococcus jejuensis]|uniref:Uncharacterized protein n=1 Tax=Agrococcus jejuensis TaxID=399736 RepID=A0A1G8BRW3_9MICO|nr:hypothetical protein [Agrococcus jejuensis]SDH35912.1 hypothetical protein SAMN04489720_1035 [Agrococcus jejuensis]